MFPVHARRAGGPRSLCRSRGAAGHRAHHRVSLVRSSCYFDNNSLRVVWGPDSVPRLLDENVQQIVEERQAP